MTTYRTKDGHEYERYTKFSHYQSPLITWIPLLVGENRVRYFDQSQLVEVKEVKSPFDSGLDYCYPQPAPLVYTVPLPPIEQQLADDIEQARIEWYWKHVYIDADLLGKYSTGKPGADTDLSLGVRLCPLWKPRTLITVFAESMRAVA